MYPSIPISIHRPAAGVVRPGRALVVHLVGDVQRRGHALRMPAAAARQRARRPLAALHRYQADLI